MKTDWSRITRPRYAMPEYVSDRLDERNLKQSFQARPAYQQNDYLGWITMAKRESTREKRLAQMLDELESGDVYMNMAWGGGLRHT